MISRRAWIGGSVLASALGISGCGDPVAIAAWPRFAPVVELRISLGHQGRVSRFIQVMEASAKPHLKGVLVDNINGILVLRLFGDDPRPVFRAAVPTARQCDLPKGSLVSRFERPGVIGERVVL